MNTDAAFRDVQNSGAASGTFFCGPIEPNGNTAVFELRTGCNIVAAHKADLEWGGFVYQALLQALGSNLDDDERVRSVANSLPIHDSHWRWRDKAFQLNGTRYTWFFLMESGSSQAICLTSHPEEAKIGDGEIFHVEFLAVAPWNRVSPSWHRRFRGLGRALLRFVCLYHHRNQSLRPGFSLGSVPQATAFYADFGLTRLEQFDHDGLSFFEMDRESASAILGGVDDGSVR